MILTILKIHTLIFLINFFICLYPNIGIMHEGHPICESEQQQKQLHSPFS